jgi:methylglutaconyl-CoA hydratase
MLGDVLAAIWEFPKAGGRPGRGPARAGGLGLIAAADIAVCTTEATFAFTEVRLGVIPAVISATVLPRLAPAAAAELYLTGRSSTGSAPPRSAWSRGRPGRGLDGRGRLLRGLVRGGPLALAGTKQLLRRAPAATSAPSWPSWPRVGRLLPLARGREGTRRSARSVRRAGSAE